MENKNKTKNTKLPTLGEYLKASLQAGKYRKVKVPGLWTPDNK